MQEQRDQQNNERANENKETKIYLTPDSTLQTPEEDRHDKSIDPEKNDQFSITDHDWRHGSPHSKEVKDELNEPDQKDQDTAGQ